nr:hypothetical protein [Tanacetum cinerariifolium]
MDSIIPLGQKNTLAKYMILSDAENRPPMLDKDLYDSWKSQMELYMQKREHRRMILESVENGLLIWPTIEEIGGTKNAAWYKEKAMLAEAHEAGQILDEQQLAFLADLRVLDGQVVQTIILNNATFQTEDLDMYDFERDDMSNA